MLDHGKKCVVIDLDETLVHSSFKVNATFRIEWQGRGRGGLCDFMTTVRKAESVVVCV